MFKIKMSDPDRSFYDPATGLFLSNGQVQEVDHLGALTKQWIQNGGIVDVTNDPDATPVVETSTQESTEEAPAGSPEEEEAPAQEDAAEEEEEAPAEEAPAPEAELSLDSLLKSVTGKKKK